MVSDIFPCSSLLATQDDDPSWCSFFRRIWKTNQWCNRYLNKNIVKSCETRLGITNINSTCKGEDVLSNVHVDLTRKSTRVGLDGSYVYINSLFVCVERHVKEEMAKGMLGSSMFAIWLRAPNWHTSLFWSWSFLKRSFCGAYNNIVPFYRRGLVCYTCVQKPSKDMSNWLVVVATQLIMEHHRKPWHPGMYSAVRKIGRISKRATSAACRRKRSLNSGRTLAVWVIRPSPRSAAGGEQLKPKWAERIGKQDGICLSFSMLEIPADSCRHSWQLAAWRKSLGPPWMRLSLAAESCQKSFICDWFVSEKTWFLHALGCLQDVGSQSCFPWSKGRACECWGPEGKGPRMFNCHVTQLSNYFWFKVWVQFAACVFHKDWFNHSRHPLQRKWSKLETGDWKCPVALQILPGFWPCSFWRMVWRHCV